MTEGESKVNNVRWYQWLWDQLGKFIKKLNRFLIWIVSLGGAGAGLWFAGAWIVGSIKSCQAEEAARDLWASQHKTYEMHKPSVSEGMHIAAISAGAEGATSFIQVVIQQRKEGKFIKDYDLDDWYEILEKNRCGYC
jgi:hypothetical protein